MSVLETALATLGAVIAVGGYLYLGAALAALFTLGDTMPRWKRVPLRIGLLFAWPVVLVGAFAGALIGELLE